MTALPMKPLPSGTRSWPSARRRSCQTGDCVTGRADCRGLRERAGNHPGCGVRVVTEDPGDQKGYNEASRRDDGRDCGLRQTVLAQALEELRTAPVADGEQEPVPSSRSSESRPIRSALPSIQGAGWRSVSSLRSGAGRRMARFDQDFERNHDARRPPAARRRRPLHRRCTAAKCKVTCPFAAPPGLRAVKPCSRDGGGCRHHDDGLPGGTRTV